MDLMGRLQMRSKLFYTDAAWSEAAWMVVMDDDTAHVVETGLTVSDAIRRSAAINKIKMKTGQPRRATVKFVGYPATALS
jgi:hypothetical protein